MQKIDRLGWAAGICMEAYGLKIGVRVNNPDVLDRVAQRLPPGWTPIDSPFVDYLFSFRLGGAGARPNVRNYTLLYAGLAQRIRTMDTDAALDVLESDLQMYVAEFARDRVFVHAGVVGWNGRAIVLPGRSFAGKSTLVAALLRAGATYYSDEYAVLDDHGNVHPYPRRLSLRQPDGPQRRRCTAADLGAEAGDSPLPVGLVAVTRYRAGGCWRPRELSAGRAVLDLMHNTIPAERAPDRVLGPLERVSVSARAVAGVRGEADETAAAILSELDRRL